MPKITAKSVLIRMSIGAAIGLAVISFFVFGVDHPRPEWGKYWRVQPLVVSPLVTAFGSLVFYSKNIVNSQIGWVNIALIVFSTLAFIISVWMSIVLGLHGTMWN